MYLVKYFLLNIVYHGYTYSLLSVLRISSTWVVTNNSLKHVHVCHAIDVTTVRQDIASAVWRAYSQLAYATHKPATALAKTGKFPPFLCKIFNDDPQFLHVFGRAPGGLLCVVAFKSVAPFLRYLTCKYTVTLKPGLGPLKVIESYTIQSGAYDFLLTFHSNHQPIKFSDRFSRFDTTPACDVDTQPAMLP